MSEQLLLPVLNVCAKDAHLALLTLDLCYKLDGQQDATILITSDRLFDFSPIIDAAQKAFKHIHVYAYDTLTGNPPWPGPQNWAWQHVAKWIQAGADFPANSPGWLWLEPDAVPLRPRWLPQLTAHYLAAPRAAFAGVACSDYTDPWYMNGVGIYPLRIVDALANCTALYTRAKAFDRAAGPEVKRSFKPLSQIVHFTKALGGGGGHSFTATSLKTLLATPALLYHGCTDGSLQLLLLGRNLPRITTSTGRNRFYHSGDLGDIIYSLPAVRELGGGELYLGPDNHTNMSTREKMTLPRTELIAPLLEAQPYIHSAAFSPLLPDSCSHDLNSMRNLLRARRLDQQPGYNLARCYLEAFGLALTNDGPAWLTVPEPRALAPVVINRSPRYHNPDFDWPHLLSTYRGQCIFIGHPSEHAAFCKEFSRVPYEPTANLLEAARLIAGSKLFVGNQSVCYAIAEGLKHPAILETCPGVCNTVFNRSGVRRDCTRQTVLPAIAPTTPRRRASTEPLVLRGPVDSFSGFGQLLGQLATGLAARGHRVRVAPSHYEPKAFQPDIPAIPKSYAKLLVDSLTPGHVIVSMHCGLPALIQGGELVLTMWESTRINPATCVALNKAARVIVPSVWNATSFDACGVEAPISLLPLGVDTAIYKPQPWSAQGPFIFGTAGRVAHGGCRKGIDDVILAFMAAFKGEPNVRLRIKCFSDCKIEAPRDSRITLDRAFLPNFATWNLASWYGSLNCFVTATRAEGWGYHPHQAMACARPVIAPCYSALTEFYDDSCGWPVDYSIVPATEYYSGKGSWAQPSLTSLAEQMRFAYEHPLECISKGEAAARRAAIFSLPAMLDRFESILKLHHLL